MEKNDENTLRAEKNKETHNRVSIGIWEELDEKDDFKEN